MNLLHYKIVLQLFVGLVFLIVLLRFMFLRICRRLLFNIIIRIRLIMFRLPIILSSSASSSYYYSSSSCY